MKRIEEANALRVTIKEKEEELKSVKETLKQIEDSCQHQWTKPEYCPEHHEAYTIPGDPPGTMGSDWRGPVYVPAETIKKWRRQCNLCGKVEITDRVKEVSTDEPRF